jgi:hypothetical protein
MDDTRTVVDNMINMKKIEKPKKIIMRFILPADFKKENEDILCDIAKEIARERNLNIKTEIERE